ncbi:hypothetical protein Tco_0454293 [Tanacetum coccineum]
MIQKLSVGSRDQGKEFAPLVSSKNKSSCISQQEPLEITIAPDVPERNMKAPASEEGPYQLIKLSTSKLQSMQMDQETLVSRPKILLTDMEFGLISMDVHVKNVIWWEKYDVKGWCEKKAHKYGRLNEKSWWEKWGQNSEWIYSKMPFYDILLLSLLGVCALSFLSFRADKWAKTELRTKWGDKWEEKFFGGVGSRQGETWHVTPDAQHMFYNVNVQTNWQGSYDSNLTPNMLA